jgi:hypothetical protein
MTEPGTIVIEVQAKVIRHGARPEAFGWSITIPPGDDPDQVQATVTDVCRRVRDEAQGKLK